MDLRGKRFVVIGGAGLIGSHTVDALLREDVREVVIYDNFARGTYANIDAAMAAVPVRVEAGATSVYAQYTVRVAQRDRIQAALAARGVPSVVHYPAPLLVQPAFAGARVPSGGLPHAEQAAREVLSLPMHPYLAEAEQVQVARALGEALAQVTEACA